MKRYEGKELDNKIESFLERKAQKYPEFRQRNVLEDLLRGFSNKSQHLTSVSKLQYR